MNNEIPIDNIDENIVSLLKAFHHKYQFKTNWGFWFCTVISDIRSLFQMCLHLCRYYKFNYNVWKTQFVN